MADSTLLHTRRKLLRSPAVLSVIVSLVVVILLLGLRTKGYLELWELKVYDWLLRIQPTENEPDPRVVLLTISEKDVEALGSWPLTDSMMAQILDHLIQFKPRVIGVDIYRNFAVPPGHESLNELLRAHSNIVMVKKFGGETLASVPPPPILENTDRIGFNDLLVDDDGVVRRGLLFLDDGQHIAYSFALRLALKYLAPEGIAAQPDPVFPDYLRLGQTTFYPLDQNYGGYVDLDERGYQFLLDFHGTPVPHRSYSIRELLSDQINPAAIRDKIVVIGVTAESIPDLFHAPYRSGLGPDRRGMYGVQVHAQVIGQLLRAALREAPRRSLSDRQEMTWILAWGFLGGLVGLFAHSTWRFVLLVAGGMVILLVTVAWIFAVGLWIPLLPPALVFVGSASLITAVLLSHEKQERTHLMHLFSRHVSPTVAETIWQQRHLFWDGGRPRSQKLTVTVLFSDLEGFTTASEQMDPQQLMERMNVYVETMAQLIMRHGGVVDDYFGDAIKANFGVPVPRETEVEIRQDAVHAVRCAIAMQAEMQRLNQRWAEQNVPTARMRVGIVTGEVVAGSLGSADRLKFTTIGDTVNIAARLESFQKDLWEPVAGESPCRILIAESTVQWLDATYRLLPIGEVSLKGKQRKVRVFQLEGTSDSVPAATPTISVGGSR